MVLGSDALAGVGVVFLAHATLTIKVDDLDQQS
jgi:hypothetical protein